MGRSIVFAALILAFGATSNVLCADVHYFGQRDADVVSDVPYGDNSEVADYALAEDAKIYYETYGDQDAQTWLVLHGGGVGCPYEMGRLVDELRRKGFRVVLPATRGQGRSEIGDKPITYLQKANDMVAVVDRLKIEKFSILGFSDGAYTAFKIAATYPDRVERVVAIGAGENIPATRVFPSSTLEDFAKFDKRFVDEKIALCPEPEKLPDFLSRYYAFFNSERIGVELFSAIQCPVLFVAGELDPNAPLDTVINAYKMTPRARLAIIPGAPHQAFITNFNGVWTNVEPFVDESARR